MRPRPRFLSLAVAAVMLGSTLVAGPVTGAGPAPAAAATPFVMNLYRDGDFVSQTNTVQCVGASMQMMLNMMRSIDDRTPEYQLELQNLARKWSPQRFPGIEPSGPPRPRRGASSRGWAFGLTRLGFGPYRVTSAATMAEAVDWAAVAMRRTGRPAGLLVWHGAHAWVMSGFQATGDPLLDPESAVTHVFVQDPFHPRVSSTWGPSLEPNSRVGVDRLDEDFVPWRPGRSNPMSGRFVIVMPLVDDRTFDTRMNNVD